MSGSRSQLRDRPGPPVRTVRIEMTPRQAEQFYDALWFVAVNGREPTTKAGQWALYELRRRIIVVAELWDPAWESAALPATQGRDSTPDPLE